MKLSQQDLNRKKASIKVLKNILSEQKKTYNENPPSDLDKRFEYDLKIMAFTEGIEAIKSIEIQYKEIEQLNQWINDLQAGMYVNCVYCGHRYGPGEETPASMADILKKHIEKCPKHPMSKLKAENEQLRAMARGMHEAIVGITKCLRKGGINAVDLQYRLKECDKAVLGVSINYHNPDDVKVFEKAEDALRDISNYLYDLMPVGELSPKEADFVWKINVAKTMVDKAIDDIDKDGGVSNATT